MNLAKEQLHAIALRSAIHSGLSRFSRRLGINPDALDDITALALAGGLFGLSPEGKVQSITGEGLETWAADVVRAKPFFADTGLPKTAPQAKPDYGRVGDGGAALRLDLANEAAHRGGAQ